MQIYKLCQSILFRSIHRNHEFVENLHLGLVAFHALLKQSGFHRFVN